MAYKLQLKRGASGSLPTGSAGEPLFTTDTNDLYIGTGSGNQRYQKYIASGTSSQFLKGDGSLDSTTYTPTSRTLTINGTSYDLSANRTWSVGTITTAAATGGGQVMFSNGATVITSVSGLYFDGVDKLGVGNSSPAYNLDVTGTFRSTGNLTAASIIKSGGTSSQYLMADGSTSTITNPVTGTGTTNYLPKWTSGSAIGNSAITDDGTTVTLVSRALSGTSATFTGNANADDYSMAVWKILDWNGVVAQIGGINASQWTQLEFFTSGTSKMALTSSGNLLVNSSTDNGNRLQVTGNGYFSGSLGVGASSPAYPIHVYATSNSRIGIQSTTNYSAFQNINDSGNLYVGIDDSTGANFTGVSYARFIYSTGQYPLITYVNGAERMRINPSGNLGLGVQPSAWISIIKSIQIGALGGTVITGNTSAGGTSTFGQNLYYDDAFRYAANGTSSYYSQISGSHIWYQAPSGTAGNAITFTQAMTLTSGGNLLLNTTTDSGERLVVSGSAKVSGNVAINCAGTNARLEVVAATGEVFRADAASGAYRIVATQTGVDLQGKLNLLNLPTSSSGLSAGDVWNDGGILKIV